MTDDGTRSSNVIIGRFGQHRDSVPVVAPLSQSAMRLHFFGMLASFQRGRAGFVSDRYLAAIHTGTSSSAITELADAGLWERINDGFQVRLPEVMRIATELEYHLAQQPLRAVSDSPRTYFGVRRRVGRQLNTWRVPAGKHTKPSVETSVSLDDEVAVQRSLPSQLALWRHLFADAETLQTADEDSEN